MIVLGCRYPNSVVRSFFSRKRHDPSPKGQDPWKRGKGDKPSTGMRQTEVSDPGDPLENAGGSNGPLTDSPSTAPATHLPTGSATNTVDESDVDEQEETGASEIAVQWTFEESAAQWIPDLRRLLQDDADLLLKRRVRLTELHPGGIAQLYSERPTRLDTLVREESALADMSERIAALDADSTELRNRHGRASVHLAIGTARWDGLPGDEVPLLMRRILLQVGNDGTITLQLLPGVEVNSRLIGALSAAGTPIDTVALAASMHTVDGFTSAAALAFLGNVGKALAGFQIDDNLVLGVFTHPAGSLYRELRDLDWLRKSTAVRALAGDPEAVEELRVIDLVDNPYDRDPWKESGLGDQSPDQLSVVEAIAEGQSLAVDIRGRQNAAKTTASIAAALAGAGKRTLVVSNDPRFHRDLTEFFEDQAVLPIIADLVTEKDSERTAADLLNSATSDRDLAEDPELEATRTQLRRTREALAEYTEALHETFEPWGLSPYDALQVLTDLTSLADPPTTSVRLGRDVLTELSADGGQAARELLERASELGWFSEPDTPGPWQGVTIEDGEEVGSLLGALGRLSNSLLPAIRMQMSSIAGRIELRQATTLKQWREQLTLLERVRRLLDTFRPEVLERSPADMVVATASRQWRKQKNINLRASKRRDLVRHARDMVRPGVHVTDLHQELVRAQEIRHDWTSQSVGDSWPVVPDSLDDLVATWEQVEEALSVLRPYLEPVYGSLDTVYVDELTSIIERLYQDPDGALEVPELLNVLGALERVGLGDLVVDLRDRGIYGESLGLELDLAWWASALGHMLHEEPRLGGFDPATLQGLLSASRELDGKQIDSLGPELVTRVLRRAREAQGMYPEQNLDLVASLESGKDTQDIFRRLNLAWDLMPIVVVSPSDVARVIRHGRTVDAVIFAGLKDIPTAVLVPAVARAEQTVAVGDIGGAPAGSVMAELAGVLPTVTLQTQGAINPILAQILAKRGGYDAQIAIPSPRPLGTVEFISVDGTGMPAPGVHAIESSSAEVNRVVELVRDHLSTRPNEDLAVVAFSDRHATRIISELRRRANEDVGFKVTLEAIGGAKSLVVSPSELGGLDPDSVIVSVGFARTPHGRIIHDFGDLSTPQGARIFEDLAAGLAGDITVVSSLKTKDIDRSRLNTEGAHLLVDLLEVAEKSAQGEVEEHPVTDDAPEHLLIDLAERLHRLGLTVLPNLGTEGGLRIPLAIGHPEVPGELLVAVLTDNESYVSEPSHRVRSRHFPQALEEHGWKVRTVLSMGVFIDPNNEAQQIVDLTLDAVDEYYARIGLPRTPAAAAALGFNPDGDELGTSGLDTGSSEPAGLSSESAGFEHTDAIPADDAPTSDVPADDAPTSDVPADDSQVHEPTLFEDAAGEVQRGGRGSRPPIASGLPLAAYSDDQLDELAVWIRSDGEERDDDQLVSELRDLLGVTRRGAQTDAVLRNVARRTR